MNKLLFIIFLITLSITSCNLLNNKENKAIDICKRAKVVLPSDNNIVGLFSTNNERNENETWLEYVNRTIENDIDVKYDWHANKTADEKLFIVDYSNKDGWGTSWEVDIEQQIVKNINLSDYLSRKYNVSTVSGNDEFEIISIEKNEFEINTNYQKDCYSTFNYIIKGTIMNKTNTAISHANIHGKLNLIFEDKTVTRETYFEYYESNYGFIPEVNVESLWEPNTIRHFLLEVQSFEKIYLSYNPEFIDVVISLNANNLVGYKFDEEIAQIDLKEQLIGYIEDSTNDKDFKKPESVILQEILDKGLLKVIKTKMAYGDFTFREDDDMHYYIIKNKSTLEEFWYQKQRERIEVYSYYSTKSLMEIKNFLKQNYGEFEYQNTEDIDSFSCHGDCILIEVTKHDKKYKIEYSWQCD